MRCTILTLVALIACQDKKPEAPPPPAVPHDGVTLVLPGAAPLQILRYHLTRGSKTASALVWDFAVDSEGQPGPMPTLVFDLETTVDDVLADGTAKLRIAVVRTTVRDRPGSSTGSDLVREQAAAMQGVIITATLAPDGALSDSKIELAATAPDSVRARLDGLSRSLEQVAMRLPTEPVGIGAAWRERKSLPAGGIRAISDAIYTLSSITGNTVTYTGTSQATGVPQTVEQDGLKVEVTNTHGHTETRGAVDLARYVLVLTSTSTFTTAMNVIAPPQSPGSGASTVTITTALQVTPRDASRPDAAAGSEAAPAPPSAGPPDAGLAPDSAGSAR
jgi:hypothetical protein